MVQWFDDKKNAEMLARKRIKVQLRAHTVIPFLHGKDWADGTIYFHCANWQSPFDGLRYPVGFHEVLGASDRSTRAECYRKLFRNWQQKYENNVDKEIGFQTVISSKTAALETTK